MPPLPLFSFLWPGCYILHPARPPPTCPHLLRDVVGPQVQPAQPVAVGQAACEAERPVVAQRVVAEVQLHDALVVSQQALKLWACQAAAARCVSVGKQQESAADHQAAG